MEIPLRRWSVWRKDHEGTFNQTIDQVQVENERPEFVTVRNRLRKYKLDHLEMQMHGHRPSTKNLIYGFLDASQRKIPRWTKWST